MNNDIVVMTDAPKTIVTVPIQPVPVIETAKLGVIYHAPLATALTPGIVQIGSGLLIANGVVSINPDIISIEQITLNGNVIEPVDKIVNLLVDKSTIGLSNVDNTSDLDKPISNATQTAFDTLSSEIQTELAGKLSIQQNVINFGKILYIKSDGTIGFKQENVEINNEAFVNVSLNTTTGILQFTRKNGEILEVDFPLEELVSDGYYDTQTEEIVLVLANGNEIRFSASTLVNIYEGDGNTVVTYIDPQTGANKIKVADAVINRLAAAETNIGVLNTAISQEITNREAADTLLQQAVNLKANKTTAIGDFIVSVNQSGTQLTFTLKDCSDTPQTKDTKTVNLPDAVVSGTLDDVNEKITLTLASGQFINIDLSDLYDTLTDLRTAINVETAARSIAIQNLDTNKVDKISGKGLSTNDFDNNYKSQIEANTSAIQALSHAVLYDAQTLTNEQQAQVRTNIGAGISNFSGAYADLTGKPTIPVKVSDLTNDTGFIINTVSNLTNYYLKSETYTKAEVQNLIAAISTLNIQIVQTLPTQDISLTTIYLVPKTTSGTNNVYDEYVYINNAWEKIGDTQIDLSNYYTKTQTDALLAEKQNNINNSNKLNADLVDDTNATHKFVTTSEKNTWDGKQNALSTAQLNAVNSGVTSATVSQVATNTNNISSLQTGKQDKLTAGTNITIDPNTNTISATGGGTVNDGTLTIQLNGSNVQTFTANQSTNATANIQALPNYSLSIGSTNGGNPRQVLFCSVNYTNFDSNSGAYFKLGAMSGHGNGSSYTFVEDIFINVNYQGTVTCQVYKYVQQAVTLDSVARNYGDVFYTIDTTNKIVYFYILLGQYSSAQFTPGTKIGAAKAVTSANGIVQYTGTPTYYSSGTKTWATGDGATYVRTNDLATVATSGSYDDLSNKPNIPADTGATSITTTGTGNAVTTASYNASTRQITLTKGSTFLTSAPVTSVSGRTGAVTTADLIADILTGAAGSGDKIISSAFSAGSGYITFESGLKMCWGTTAKLADYAFIYVGFPISFAGLPVVTMGTAYGKDDGTWAGAYNMEYANNSSSLSPSGFNLFTRGKSSSNGRVVYWFAIGV